MHKITSLFIIVIALIISNIDLAKATHVAGADITYEQVGIDSYLITVGIFEDCGGSATVGPSITVQFVDSCNLNTFTSLFNQVSITEVSQLCSSELFLSTCNGGNLPGMLKKVYQRVVVLGACDNWTISWGIANRSASVNLDPPGNSYFFDIDTKLNTLISNNSPVFNAQPIPNVCANQPVNFSFAVTETDGDSLVYSFTDPLGGSLAAPFPLAFQPGFTTLQPLPGIVIGASTGIVSFTPTVLGNYVVAVKIEEYRNGILIGFVKRDLQFGVRSCTNNAPSIFDGVISNLTGNAIQTGPYSLKMCEGNTINFTLTYTDADLTDSLTINTEILTILSGATINTTGSNPLTVNISWTAQSGSAGQNNSFAIFVTDSVCSVPGIQSFVYNINVIPSTYIVPGSAVICNGNSVQLNVFGGTDFLWYDINGNEIIADSTFSCNYCPNPIVTPGIATSYIVKSNLSGGCTNLDTIVVSVSSSAPIIPIVSQVGMTLETTSGFNSYQWFNNGILIPNETSFSFTPTSSGDYYVLVNDSNGCQSQSAIFNFVFVGLNEIHAKTNLTVSPNPANNFITIKSENNNLLTGNLKISGINGELVFEKQMLNSYQFTIDIEQWANGMYIIEIMRNENITHSKFIKQ